MANQTVYPFGTGGNLPSSVGIINDLTTGGADKALSAEMGKVLNGLPGAEEVFDLSTLTKYAFTISSNGTWTQATGGSSARSVIVDLTNVVNIKITMDGSGGVIAFLKSVNMVSGGAVDFSSSYTSRISLNNNTTTEYSKPYDANFLYVAANNTDGTALLPNYTLAMTKISNAIVRSNDIVDNLTTESTERPLSAKQGVVLNRNIDFLSRSLYALGYTTGSGIIEYDTGAVASSSTAEHTDYIDISGYASVRYARVEASSTTTKAGMAFYNASKQYISGQRWVTGAASSGWVETDLAIPTGAKYARFSLWTGSPNFYVLGITSSPKPISEEIFAITSRAGGSLAGKKVSIIGDSISCFGTEAQVRAGNYTTPYFKVLDGDVGDTIESWVTWLDVYTSVDSTSRTNKTIGGVTLTPEMIGTKQTFTPVAADVGKCIGIPRWASAYTTKPWWQVFIDQTGAVFCANASWSGARVVPYPVGTTRHDAFVMSEMYSDYTLGRVKGRAADGTDIIPDIILLYRGTNDFLADDPTGNESITTPDMKSFTAITDTHNFTQGYIWSILKLRELYPNAVIILCTLNVFKGRNKTHFPSNNGDNTLPEYSDKIREIANIMGCGVIEFDKDGITWENCYPTYISDSSTGPLHPNTTGHAVMGRKAVSDVKYYLP